MHLTELYIKQYYAIMKHIKKFLKYIFFYLHYKKLKGFYNPYYIKTKNNRKLFFLLNLYYNIKIQIY